MASPDPNNPQPTPDNPNPEPARPPMPPETEPGEPPGVPSPSPDPIPSPDEEPLQIPPDAPPEVPSEPTFPAPTAILASVVAAAFLSCIVAVNSPAAQTLGDGQSVTEPTDPCRAQPNDQAQSDGDATEGQAGNDPSPALDHCNGVLTPPPTGDQDIEQLPPDDGATPVIPPETVPEQPPK